MADPYADLANAPEDMQQRIADAMVARCVDPAQIALRRAYLSEIALPDGAHAVEMGSGTGHVTCDLIDMTNARTAHGIEPSLIMVRRARDYHAGRPEVTFTVGDATRTGLPDASCDLVVMHTLLCHVPGPERAVQEAARILKSGGILAICDGDYDTATTAIADFDPLDQLIAFMIRENVTNLRVMRQVGPMLSGAGFEAQPRQGHGYVADGDPAYFLTVIDRGADIMADRGLIGTPTRDALKQEARDRIARRAFFGFMSYVSVTARKSGVPA